MQDLIQMLEDYEIQNIISVDDSWSILEGVEDKLVAQGVDEGITIKKYCEAYLIDVDVDEVIEFNMVGDTPLRELDTVGVKIPKTFVGISESLNIDIDASLKTLKSILDHLKSEEKFCVYRGIQFEDSYKEVRGNTLYIFDKDMGENRENEFLEYILSITNERKMSNDLVIVYSNGVSNLLSHEKKLQYLEENNRSGNNLEVLYQFWPLSKVTDEDLLISGIKQMISKSMYGKALSRMIEMRKTSIEKAFKDLLKINIDCLDDMIIESYIEGGKITESYELLMDSLIRKNALEQIMVPEGISYEKVLLRYEERRAKEILEEKEIHTQSKYKGFRETSQKRKVVDSGSGNIMLYNIADYSVNKQYSNPMMGDIFVFSEATSTKKCAGMLISQECSTMIRKSKFAERPRRTANELLLLVFDIVEISEENIDNRRINKLDSCIWPIKIGDKVYLLDNTLKSMYVSPEILDLCGLNSDGRANIQYDEEALEYKGVYSKEYYRGFKQLMEQKIVEITSSVMQENGIRRRDKNLKNLIVSLAFGIEYNGNFELQRICRINEKHTLHIIHEYLNGIGKIGVPVLPNLQ